MLKDRASVPPLGELEVTKDGKVIGNDEPEELDPNDEPVTVDEEKEDSDAEYVKMELCSIGKSKKSTMS